MNVWLKLPPDIAPEFQSPSPLQQAPDVVEWKPLAQFQVTVPPTRIVLVLLPLVVSRKTMPPPAPTSTLAFVEPVVGVGVAAGIGVDVGAGGAVVPGLGVGVAVGTTAGSVGDVLWPHEMTAEKVAAKTAAARKRKRGDLMGHLRDRM